MKEAEKISLLDGKNKVAFVTGAYGGIGKSVVKMLLNSGSKVVATGRSDFRFSDNNVYHLNLDVTEEDEVENAISKCIKTFGRLDFLIHLAGMVGSGRLDEMSLDNWNTVVKTNLTSAFLLSMAIKKYLNLVVLLFYAVLPMVIMVEVIFLEQHMHLQKQR